MTPYIPGTKIKIRIPCPDCVNGKVELPGPNKDFITPGVSIKLYHMGYCPTCGGKKWLEDWVSIETLSKWVFENHE